ncbi:hypothetical protein CVT26_001831 [Gymnopilus dilepis]|uniref:Uncharacterized protein n=1 Tax=Gymnopilus dilepis TaxID=231916 RepID=A0A409X557_9AGAR|nr:hypothetical protein CVT26_001831 [Gymnopilus dilepis]
MKDPQRGDGLKDVDIWFLTLSHLPNEPIYDVSSYLFQSFKKVWMVVVESVIPCHRSDSLPNIDLACIFVGTIKFSTCGSNIGMSLWSSARRITLRKT